MLKNRVAIQPAVTFHSPTVEDVDAIDQLIRSYSAATRETRLLLPRSQASILSDLQNFITLKSGDEIVGCVSLKIWSKDRAEVRSLAVKSGHQGLGLGQQLLGELSLRAKALKIKTLFALTLEPSFFKKSGFHVVPKLRFPEKIDGDCLNCVFQSSCQEIAVSKTITAKTMKLVPGGSK